VYSSFAIHHLLDKNKEQLFKVIFEHLKPGGIFIYIDAYQKYSTGLEAYRAEYSEWVDDTWQALSGQEKQEIKDHLCTCDFPSTQTWTSETLLNLGFKLLDSNFEDPRHFYSCYQKT
jgi:cyclopropane fatty-acyl-phospholipid synthase-like methyltransferase